MKKNLLVRSLVFIYVLILTLFNAAPTNAQTNILGRYNSVDVWDCAAPATIEIFYNFDTTLPDSSVVIQNVSGFRSIDTDDKRYKFCAANGFAPCGTALINNGEFQITFTFNSIPVGVKKVSFRILNNIGGTITVTCASGTTVTKIGNVYTCKSATTFNYVKIVSEYNSSFNPGEPNYHYFVLDELHIPTPSPPEIGAITQPTCALATGSVALSELPPTGTWTVTASPGGSTITGTGTTGTFSGLAAGTTFTFKVTDAEGCISAASGNAGINAQPSTPTAPTVVLITQPTCATATGSVALSDLPAAGSWTVTATPGGSTITGTGLTGTFSGLAAGTTYTFRVTNSAGCISAASGNAAINAQPSSPLAPTVSPITQPTCATATGSVALSGLPAAGSWTVTATPGGSTITGTGLTGTFSGLTAGTTYTFRVTNSAGCISAASGNAGINAQPSTPAAPTAGPITQPTCATATGSVALSGLPAAGSWTVTATPGGSVITGTGLTGTFSGLTAGTTYTFRVTNSAGCISVASGSAVVNGAPPSPTASVIAGTGSMCIGESRTLTVTITGGTSPYTVVLSDGTTKTGYTTGSSISVSPSTSTTYTITSVTDANGCPSAGLSGSAIVTLNALPTVNLGEDQTVCTGGSTTFDAGPGFIAYAWSTGALTQTITVNTEGTYSVTVTDANNCQNSDEAELIVNTIPEVVCLMDLSGSMSWDYSGNENPPLNQQRIDYAKNALIAFTDLLYTNYPNCAYYGLAGFRKTFSETSCNGYEFFPMSILNIINSGTLINTTIPSLFAEGSTPLLAGLEKAINMFVTNNKKSIVLLSDGVHNCPYEVGIDDPTLNSLIEECKDAGIEIFPIAFGQDYNINHDLLKYLADQTDGTFYDVTVQHGKTEASDPDPILDPSLIAAEWHPETALNIAYADILSTGLGFDYTLEPMGVIDHGEIKQIDVPVTIFDKNICFFTSWVTSQPDYLKIKIFSSDGVELPAQHPGIIYSKHNNHTIVTISDKFLNQQGKVSINPWKFEIDASEVNASENYQFMVLNKSKKLTLKTSFDKRSYYTGDKMKIFLELLVEGQRMTGLDGINITGTRPEDGLGNWLSHTKLTAQKLAETKKTNIDQVTILTLEHATKQNLNTVQKQNLLDNNISSLMDNLTPAQLKAQIMIEEMKLKLPGRIAVRDFFFNDEGISGDETAGDGIYTAVYNKLAIEGSYFFNITVIDTSKGKNIRREAQMQKYVNADIRSKRFIKNITLIDSLSKGNKVYLVTLKLKDKYGNVPSPSALFNFKLMLDKGELLGKIQANPDGSFTQIVALPGNVNPRNINITMKVYDQVGVQRLKPFIPSWIYLGIFCFVLVILGINKRKKIFN